LFFSVDDPPLVSGGVVLREAVDHEVSLASRTPITINTAFLNFLGRVIRAIQTSHTPTKNPTVKARPIKTPTAIMRL
jgi:hypothetical protein